jgi:cell division protein FtsW
LAKQLKTDWILFFTIVGMVCFGTVMVYSASSVMAEVRFRNSSLFVLRQAGWAVAGLVAMMYFKHRDYRSLSAPGWAFIPLGVVVALLVAVYFTDKTAHRWLRIGPVGLQPAEFTKPALAIFLAWFVTRRAHAINNRHTLLPASLALGLLAVIVMIADLGTAAVLMLTAGALFYVAGLDRRYFLVVAAIGLLALPVAILSKPYRVLRLVGYFDPNYTLLDRIDPDGHVKKWAGRSLAPKDAGYQALQSKIAVGSGGVFGLGLMEGGQKMLYLPEAHNDFIYAIVCEELGLWGATGLLLCYLIILWRGFRLFWTAGDEFGKYLALGLSTALVVQALMNMTVVLDMAPTKGFTLPLISYGGSSLLSSLTSLGMLLSVGDHAA